MKEKIERNIDKDIERCKELIKIEHSNWIGMSNQDAISNVLSDREMWKKIAEKLASVLSKKGIVYFEPVEPYKERTPIKKVVINGKDKIIDWARKEVDKQ